MQWPPSLGPLVTGLAIPGLGLQLWPAGSSSSFSHRSPGRSGTGPGTPSPDGGVRIQIPSCCCRRGALLTSSGPSGKRGTSSRPEQRRRTVMGGLESLSVCEDSDTESRFRNLGQHEAWHELAWHVLPVLCSGSSGTPREPHGVRAPPELCHSQRKAKPLPWVHPGAHISGEPMIQLRSRPLSPARLSERSSFSSLRLRLVGGGVRRSSSSESRSMLLYTCGRGWLLLMATAPRRRKHPGIWHVHISWHEPAFSSLP